MQPVEYLLRGIPKIARDKQDLILALRMAERERALVWIKYQGTLHIASLKEGHIYLRR